MILQAFLLGCIAFIGKCDLATGTNMIQRPIVLGPFVGLILGDPELGIKIGATLELAFLGFALGSTQMQAIVNAIPEVITNGLSIACGMLPGIGFAMLAQMIMNKDVVPFFFLGFVLSAYFGIPVVGIAIIGVIAVFIKINFHEEETLAVQGGLDEDDDF